MAATAVRRLAYATLAVLYLLHNDLWFWYDEDRFLGLPVGLTYHLLFAGAVVLTMWWLVRGAWPPPNWIAWRPAPARRNARTAAKARPGLPRQGMTLTIIFGYLLAVLLIGVWSSRRLAANG